MKNCTDIWEKMGKLNGESETSLISIRGILSISGSPKRTLKKSHLMLIVNNTK